MSFPYLIISDKNYRQYAGRADKMHHDQLAPILQGNTGYLGWRVPGSRHELRGSQPVGPTIPRSQWVSMIQAGAGSKILSLIKSSGMKAQDQNGLNYCWAYASVRTVEIRRLLEGLPLLELSPESVGGPCTNWKNVGGYASEAFEQMEHAGICEQTYLNAPHSLKPSLWKANWTANAVTHETIDWYEIGTSYDEVVTCALKDCPVSIGLDWWGHEIAVVGVVIGPTGEVLLLCMNSWGVDWPSPGANGLFCLTESRGTPDGAAAPLLTIDAPVGPVDPGPAPGPPPA